MAITGNRRNALWLAGISLAASLLAFLFLTAGAGLSPLMLASPVVIILVFAPLAGILGIIFRNKEVLIISSIMSFASTILGIVSIGMFFTISSLLLMISAFVYLRDEPAAYVNEKAKKAAFLLAFASLFAAIAATAPEVATAPSIIVLVFMLIFYSLPLILPVLGIAGIRRENKEFLFAASAMFLVLSVFLALLFRKPLFLASSLLLILSSFAYQGGRMEMMDARLKKIALVLAGISMVAAVVTTIYSEQVLVTGGCYDYQTSPTSGGSICSDFRLDYVIPVIISAVGMAGILRENKLLLYASATVSFVRIIANLQPIANLFVPSFIALIFSAIIYKMGIRRLEPQVEVQENIRDYYVLLLLLAIVIFWMIAVYTFVQPSSIETSGGYGYDHVPAIQIQ